MQERLQNEANELPSAVVLVDDEGTQEGEQTGASTAAAAAAAPAAAGAAATGAAEASATAEGSNPLAAWQEAALAELDAALKAAAERGPPAEAPAELQQQQQPSEQQQQQGPGGRESVTADYIVEPPPPFTGDSKAAALLEIIGSGDALEEKIAQHGDMLDAEMLEMLARRIQAAEAMEEEQAVQGLKLLYRRLKAEVDRKGASPAMRLLDDLLNILDDDEDESPSDSSQGADADADAAAAPAGEGGAAAGGAAEEEGGRGGSEAAAEAAVALLARQQEERRARAWTRLQAAFGGGLPRDADPFTLAAKLAEGGEQLADRLFEDVVDPQAFLKEVGQLQERASEQRDMLVEYIELNRHELEAGQLSELQEVLEQRSQALRLVEEVMELAAQWTNQQRQQMVRDWAAR